MEAVVRQARQAFGDTLPSEFLSAEEYHIYERLYGAPLQATNPNDIRLQHPAEEAPGTEDDAPTLLRLDEDGELEEVAYDPEITSFDQDPVKEPLDFNVGREIKDEFNSRITLYKDIATAQQLAATPSKEDLVEDDGEEFVVDEGTEEEDGEMLYGAAEEVEDLDNAYQTSDSLRTHPLTAEGRFGTSPATLWLPNDTVVNPVTSLLADSSNKQLSEMAQEKFGGPALPNSTATPASKQHLQQAPIALEAAQSKMGDMEANAYIAAIMPGAYATVMSTLVEVRKRLGPEWLPGLLRSEKGPRILDAGGGGAGVLAFREVLAAEWEHMHPGGVLEEKPVPFGKATVLTGSDALRHRVSKLLENTTFLPRLPDYVPARDNPTPQDSNVPPRKKYDVIVAPYTLWTLKEDYMRKNQVQNFWSLLNPDGGVLIVIEKGVPRGFELVAGAREVLLKYHIASPGSDILENEIQTSAGSRWAPKEDGMIIAPCSNHGKCPLYLIPGRSKGRKDTCHFNQRFIRPKYLQRILGVQDRNHEDIHFSYVAVQRGVDLRKTQNIVQGDIATEAAFAGFGDEDPVDEVRAHQVASDASKENVSEAETELQPVAEHKTPSFHALSVPRTILPPIKRRGHIILDLCTPSGHIERWTVPRSFGKQAYRDARKSQWGDLWALGAKTRVPRNVRAGTIKTDKKPKKGVAGLEEKFGKDIVEDVKEALGIESDLELKDEKAERKGRKGKYKKKPKSKKMLSEDAF